MRRKLFLINAFFLIVCCGAGWQSPCSGYARVNWLVRPIETEIEDKLLSQLSAEFDKSELFKEVCPFDNDIISQMDEAAKEMEVKRLAESNQQALPES